MRIFYKLNYLIPKAKLSLMVRGVSLIGIYFLLPDIAAGNPYISQANEKVREKWIMETIREIKNFGPEKCFNILSPTITEAEGFYRQSYRLNESGCIFFENGDWIYLVSNSEYDYSEVGDITLAVDNHQRMWINKGHVFGGIINFGINQNSEDGESVGFFNQCLIFTNDKSQAGQAEETILRIYWPIATLNLNYIKS